MNWGPALGEAVWGMPGHIPAATSPAAVLGLGLVLGLRHALDSDHLVAVAAIAAQPQAIVPQVDRPPAGVARRGRTVSRAMSVGLAWGIGHAGMIGLVGSVLIAFRVAIPARLGLVFELAVALALIAVGVGGFRRRSLSKAEPPAARTSKQALVVGMAHGLAGSGAVALLVLGTVQHPALAYAYLLIFGLGTLAGMALVTAGMASPFAIVADRWPGSARVGGMAAAGLSAALGGWLVYRIGYVDGLLRMMPH